MNFATRFLTTLGAILGLNKAPEVPVAQGPLPVAPEPGTAARYYSRGGMFRRRYYVLPPWPLRDGSTWTTPDRRATSPEVSNAIERAAQIKSWRRNASRRIVDKSVAGFKHSPGLLTVSERLKRQAVRAERKGLARGEIPS